MVHEGEAERLLAQGRGERSRRSAPGSAVEALTALKSADRAGKVAARARKGEGAARSSRKPGPRKTAPRQRR
jgi:hypothetical protein